MNSCDFLYSTVDEICFLRGLLTGAGHAYGVHTRNGWSGRGANPEAFLRYAEIVLLGMRRYDAGVDLSRVKAAIAEMMPLARVAA